MSEEEKDCSHQGEAGEECEDVHHNPSVSEVDPALVDKVLQTSSFNLEEAYSEDKVPKCLRCVEA